MLLLHLLLAHFTLGSSLKFSENLCYGATYNLPIHFTPGMYNKTITYTTKEGQSKVVVNNGQSLDSRYKVARGKIQMENICERDDYATLSITSHFFDSVILKVKNCRSTSKKLCGSLIKWQIPFSAQYLEFSGPDVHAPPVILWNRTSQSSIRGAVSGGSFEIRSLTQKDSGYYRFRGSKDELLKWEQIVVEEHDLSFTFDEGKIKFDYPIVFNPAQVKFTSNFGSGTKTLSKNDDRYEITNTHLTIEYATPEDSGTYDFLDKDGNRILHVILEVNEVEKVWVSLVVLAGIFCGFIVCCCCLTKYCCKDSSNKTNGPESDAEAPTAVHHNGTQTHTEPVTPLLAPEPRVVLPEPPTYSETGAFMDPPPPYEMCVAEPSAPPVAPQSDAAPAEAAVNTDRTVQDREGVGADVSCPDPVSDAATFSVNTFDINTDPDPHFELSGTVQPSAPPLASDGSNSAFYDSDKLSFFK